MTLPSAAVIGAGPAGLMASEVLARAGVAVTVYDRMPSPARKFLMAGRGGLNLTHAEPLEHMLTRYGPARALLEPALRAFPPEALRAWADELGAETFVGSSNLIFPKAMKASPLLRAWLRRLEGLGVRLQTGANWTGFGSVEGTPDVTILALGGASWPRLGADGSWVDVLTRDGIAVTPLAPANGGFTAALSETYLSRFAGSPLKRIAVRFSGVTHRGEAMVTRHGLEGGALYALAPQLRTALAGQGSAMITIDLRPDLSLEALNARLGKLRPKQTLSNHLRKAAGLSPAAIGLLREANAGFDASAIKACPVIVTAMQGLARAISTAGGIAFDELDPHFMLKKRPGVFACGEMLDWEAPTGGYLLQACLSTAVAAAEGAKGFLGSGAAIA